MSPDELDLCGTHFLVTHISVGLRAGILGWVTYHFLVTHVRK